MDVAARTSCGQLSPAGGIERMASGTIGVFGGTGFYQLSTPRREIAVSTPYGDPSSSYKICDIAGKEVVFLPRHGEEHHIPPHKINYRANVWGMKQLGVEQIISFYAAGSLQRQITPGTFVVTDQFVDRTKNRLDTFYDGPDVFHLSITDPYCPQLQLITITTLKHLHFPLREKGTVVVIEGPRFSSKAESQWFSSMGWDIINMTQYPECYLARELGICYMGLALVTDYDAGFSDNDLMVVSNDLVLHTLQANFERLKDVLISLLPAMPQQRTCHCAKSLENAGFSKDGQ
jgi:5'-methylthioadenosine phosphorylase